MMFGAVIVAVVLAVSGQGFLAFGVMAVAVIASI